jgi:hypothetical protein
MEVQIRMVSTASEVFNFKKKNPNSIHEEVFQHVSNYIESQKIKEEKIKIAMIAAAGKAFEMIHQNPTVPEKLLLKDFMNEIPGILARIEE